MAHQQIVEVAWVDATGYPEWLRSDEIMTRPLMGIKTVGYLVSRTRTELRLLRSLARDCDEDSGGDLFIIPASWVTRVRHIGRAGR